MECLDTALLDTPTSPTSTKQEHGTTPQDFSRLTPFQFGITANSFSVPAKLNDKSRVAQLKARRRSSIGVRGSPETNSLIRHIAKQRMLSASPMTERLQLQSSQPRSQTLRQKMAAFQSVMEGLDEEGKLESMASLTKNNLSLQMDKENKVILGGLATPPPSKKVCRTPPRECKQKITEVTTSFPACTSAEKFLNPNAGKGILFRNFAGHVSCPVPLQEMNINLNRNESTGDLCTPSVAKKRRVHFGAPLSPEFFDKSLPPSTPLQKGGTPFHFPTPAGSQLRSLLKTPQRTEAATTEDQPGFTSAVPSGGSPTLRPAEALEEAICHGVSPKDAHSKRLLPRPKDNGEALWDLETELTSPDAPVDGMSDSQANVVTSLFQEEPPLEDKTRPTTVCTSSVPQTKSSPRLQKLQPGFQVEVNSSPPGGHSDSETVVGSLWNWETALVVPDSQSRATMNKVLTATVPSSSTPDQKAHPARLKTEPKRVHFAEPLSPEYFDKSLPPSTPLRRGGTPYRQPTESVASPDSRTMLETPLTQPVFNSPEACNKSSSNKPDRVQQGGLNSEPLTELFEQDAQVEQVHPMLLEERDEVELADKSTGLAEHAASDELPDPSATNMSCQCQDGSVTEKLTEASQQMPISSPLQQAEQPRSPPHPLPPPGLQQEPEASKPAKPRGRKRKLPQAEVVEGRAADAKEEAQPERRRPSRSAALSASGKIKDSTGKRQFGSKEVDRSLYGKRAYASKNPLLSPIFEASSGDCRTPTEPSGSSKGKPTSRKSAQKKPSEAAIKSPMKEVKYGSDKLATSPSATLEASCLPPLNTSIATATKGRGHPGPKAKPKSPKAKTGPTEPPTRHRRRSSGPLQFDMVTPVASLDPSCDTEKVTQRKRSKATVLTEAKQTSPGQQEGKREPGAGCPEEVIQETETKLSHQDHNRAIKAGSSPGHAECPGEGSKGTETLQHHQQDHVVKRRGRPRKSLVMVETTETEGGFPSELSCETSELICGQTQMEAPEHVPSCGNNAELAPWQRDEFNIEDVLKPVAAGRRSVRRSLRNQSEQVAQSNAMGGLTWITRTSPDSASMRQASRRRSRSRLSLQPSIMPDDSELKPCFEPDFDHH